MNRQQRRAYNKQHGTNYTKEQFRTFELLAKIKRGEISLDELKKENLDTVTVDNEERAPEGSLVKLNYERIKERNPESFLPLFLDWVEQHKDDVFHLTRKHALNSLVCLQEDVDFYEKKKREGEEVRQPWLFDIYSDLLFFDEKEKNWVTI